MILKNPLHWDLECIGEDSAMEGWILHSVGWIRCLDLDQWPHIMSAFANQNSSSWELCFLSLKHCTQTHRSSTTIRDRSSFDPFWPHFYDDQLIKKGFEFCYWYEWCYAWLAHFQQLWSGSLKIGIRQSITTILIVFCSERSCLFQKSCSSAW